MESLKTLSPESLDILKSRGNDLIVKNGFRAILKTAYTSESNVDCEAPGYIPDNLKSIETLQFLELTSESATMVWSEYLQDKIDRPSRAHVLSQAKLYVSRFPNLMKQSDDWYGSMDAMGLNKSCQDRLMDQVFGYMRLGSSLHETVHDMMDMRYRFLRGLDAHIQARGRQKSPA